MASKSTANLFQKSTPSAIRLGVIKMGRYCAHVLDSAGRFIASTMLLWYLASSNHCWISAMGTPVFLAASTAKAATSTRLA
jgi:hypothetical protein